MMYKACGGHMTMDDFRGRPAQNGSQQTNGLSEKQMLAAQTPDV